MKIIVVCPYLQTMSRGNRISLMRNAEKAMEAKRPIHSASGATAAVAIDCCERNKWNYRVDMVDGRYFVERI